MICSKIICCALNAYNPFAGLAPTTTKRRNTDKKTGLFEHITVDCPEVVVHYNESKDAVDQFDKHCLKNNFSLERSQVSRKWWHKLYWGLLDSALVNSFLLWTMCHGECDKFTFMTMVQQGMLNFKNDEDYNVSPRSDRKRMQREDLHDVEGAHFPERIPANRRLVCEVCKVKNAEERSQEVEKGEKKASYKKPTRTRFWCLACNTPLCVEPCFGTFHVEKTTNVTHLGTKKVRFD